MTPPDLLPAAWRKARRSGGEGGNCIEMENTMTALRDSKNPAGPVLSADVLRLLAVIKAGHLDR